MTAKLSTERLKAAALALTPYEQKLTGAPCVRHIIGTIQNAPYVIEQAYWDRSDHAMRVFLWQLSGCNGKFNGTQFKAQWLELDNEAKELIRVAIKHSFYLVNFWCNKIADEIENENNARA